MSNETPFFSRGCTCNECGHTWAFITHFDNAETRCPNCQHQRPVGGWKDICRNCDSMRFIEKDGIEQCFACGFVVGKHGHSFERNNESVIRDGSLQ